MHHPPNALWRTSSYSGGSNNCVEVAAIVSAVGVRDSKDTAAGAILLSPADWRALTTQMKAGRFDL